MDNLYIVVGPGKVSPFGGSNAGKPHFSLFSLSHLNPFINHFFMQPVSLKLQKLASPKKAKVLQGFFRTDVGEYGEGDVFLGVTVPQTRSVAKEFSSLEFSELQKLLKSKIHEERLAALLILVQQFEKGDSAKKLEVFDFYRENISCVNNWDLVDLSAPKICGAHLLENDRQPLYRFALSGNLWERRIAIVSCYTFIRRDDFSDALKISETLLSDSHDLIHKAVGWMLREIGKRNLAAEEKFLKKHYKKMPRTMLRYAIEKFPETKRKAYLSGKV